MVQPHRAEGHTLDPIPATCREPITLTHLLTHTAGCVNRDLGLVAPALDALPPLAALLARLIAGRFGVRRARTGAVPTSRARIRL